MTCQNVMLTNPVTVSDGALLSEAIDLLLEHRIKTLPLVDGQGRYRGLFGIHTLIQTLLPRAAILSSAGLTDLTFVRDTLATVSERLTERLKEPVLNFSDREFAPLTPDESLLETLLFLHRHRHTLPVVDPASGRLLGVVTYLGVLAKLAGRTL